jgi:hypothetical protein
LSGSSANFGADRMVAAALCLEQIGLTSEFKQAGRVCQELDGARTELHDALTLSATADAVT